MAEQSVAPLVVIIGQTGTGKTALSMRLAEHFNGEVIAADSRTVYREMDIGTAKPSQSDRERVAHYGLDVVAPDQQFSAFEFKNLANKAINTITGKARLPLLVGGTGLYVDAVLYDFSFRSPGDLKVRARLQSLTREQLQDEIRTRGLQLPKNEKNPIHLQRVLESGSAPNTARILRQNTLVLGLPMLRDELRHRIISRTSQMLDSGLLDEARFLQQKYGEVAALRAPAYKALYRHLQGSTSLLEAELEIIRNDMSLAKRQRTWFRRNTHIRWLNQEDKFAESVDIITTFIHEQRTT